MKPQYSTLASALGALVISAAALVSGGCASIVHHGNRSITINTVPAGAKATIRRADTGVAVQSGTTPLTVSLDPKGGYFRGQNYVIRLEMPGYHWTEVPVRSELSGWYWGNIVFGGLIGLLIVDPLTGSMWNLAPENVQYSLNKEEVAMINSGKGFVVVMLSEVSESERAKMVRIN